MKSGKYILIFTQVLILFVAFIFSAHAVQQKPIKLVYITFFASSHDRAQLCREWAKEIEKRTQGALEITFIHGETYLHGDEIYEGIVLGAADIGMSAFAYNHGQFPVMEAVDFSIGYRKQPFDVRARSAWQRGYGMSTGVICLVGGCEYFMLCLRCLAH